MPCCAESGRDKVCNGIWKDDARSPLQNGRLRLKKATAWQGVHQRAAA